MEKLLKRLLKILIIENRLYINLSDEITQYFDYCTLTYYLSEYFKQYSLYLSKKYKYKSRKVLKELLKKISKNSYGLEINVTWNGIIGILYIMRSLNENHELDSKIKYLEKQLENKVYKILLKKDYRVINTDFDIISGLAGIGLYYFYLNNLCVIMSNNTDYNILKEYYNEKNESVYIDKFIPQQFVLKNSDLFISSAGQNSIIEAIYHKIPILAMPLTSEQKLNGLLIEDSGIGLTTYIKREKYMTYGELVKSLLFEAKYKEKLDILNTDLTHGNNNFDLILDYVKEKQEKINNFYIIR